LRRRRDEYPSPKGLGDFITPDEVRVYIIPQKPTNRKRTTRGNSPDDDDEDFPLPLYISIY
jgi:hypothetical protein